MPASLKHFDLSGGVQITEKDWPDAIAGAIQTAEKFFAENNGDRVLNNLLLKILAVGINDGSTQMRIGTDVVTLSTPFGFAAALTGAGAGGVWSGTGIRGYRITGINATGETIGSLEVTANVDDTTKKVNLSWTLLTGATGYRIYRTDTPGVYGASSLRVIIGSGSTIVFTDDGGATTAGTLPTTNTTGGAGPTFGTPPALGTVTLVAGNLAIGQQYIYWVNRVVPAGASEIGNPRAAQLKFEES